MTRGGKRAGAGAPVTTGRGASSGGSSVYVRLSQEERGRGEDVLRDERSLAALARALLIAEIERRERQGGR